MLMLPFTTLASTSALGDGGRVRLTLPLTDFSLIPRTSFSEV